MSMSVDMACAELFFAFLALVKVAITNFDLFFVLFSLYFGRKEEKKMNELCESSVRSHKQKEKRKLHTIKKPAREKNIQQHPEIEEEEQQQQEKKEKKSEQFSSV